MLEIFVTFFKLGLFTIGGGVAMIPILSNIMVKDKKWFTEDEMIDIIAICQGLPGVIAINMATYVGFKKRGLIGSFVATFGVILPSFCDNRYYSKRYEFYRRQSIRPRSTRRP